MSATLMGHLSPRQTTTSDTGSSAGEQVLGLLSNPFQAALQTNAFWASLGTSVGISVLLAALFSLVRPRHRLIYAPKTKHADEKHAPPPVEGGLLSWVKPVMRTSENVLMDKIGMDAVVFLRFTRMLRNMFIALSAIGICIMIPVNVTLGNKQLSQGGSGFAIMTPLYVFHNGLWAQVVVAWATNIIVAYFLWHNYRRIHQLRRAYLESPDYQASLHARTLFIRDVPSTLRSEEGLLRITDEVNPTGVTPKTAIGRNVKVLPDLIEEHEEMVRKLESVLAKYLKNPDQLPPNRPTMRAPKKYRGHTSDGKVDAIDYLTDRIRELEGKISETREQVDQRDAMSYGFASWEKITDAHAVAFASRKKNPQGTKVQLAPRPNDLIWNNLHLSKAVRKRKRVINALWIAVLTILWMPLNALIAIFLSNLSNLGLVWPGFQRQLEAHATGWAIVQGIASPALTSLVYLVLPIIFRRLQIRAGDVTKTEREQHVLRNLFTFFTLNNLVVFSLFSAIWQYVTVVIAKNKGGNSTWDALRGGELFVKITISLCQISPFWVTWLLQRNLGAAIDLAQLWRITVVWFERTFMAPTPRQNIEWTAPIAFEYAAYYNYFLFYATVALCFSTLQPLVLVVTALYFSFDTILKKYLLMYVFITKTESGGAFWRTLFNRLIFSTMLSDAVIAIVVIARGTWVMFGLLIALIPILGVFKWYCAKTFDAEIKYYTTSGMQDQERHGANDGHNHHRVGQISSRFGHPALLRPLMTPMVHAKARHILQDIYRGRLGSEGGHGHYAAASADNIAMEPMNPGGKTSIQENAPFELVPEAQQDFSYYKNRPDFREEGGEIYGQTEDLMSERTGTPMSFMSMGKVAQLNTENDPYLSSATSPPREGSPAPDNKRFSGIKRKEIGNPTNVHPAFRSATSAEPSNFGPLEHESEPSHVDLGMRHGAYTDPYDDRTNLLRDVGAGDPNVSTPSGEFMSIDRWKTGSTAPTPYDKEAAPGSYDYLRGR